MMNHIRKIQKRRWIAVRSDRGEEFPSAKHASLALGKNAGSVRHAIRHGQKCAGRFWEEVSDE